MKVYVSELPQNCYMCPCFDGNFCLAGEGLVYVSKSVYEKGRNKNCPLQSLSDYTKQVRKEVVQELKEKLKSKEVFHPEDEFTIDYDFYYKEDVEDILNEILGE